MSTLNTIVSEAIKLYGNATPDLPLIISTGVTNKINSLCRSLDLWFANIEPNPLVAELFPYASIDDVTTYDETGTWFDQGWFISTEDKSTYDVYLPSDYTDYTEDWTKIGITKINYVKEHNLDGAVQKILRVVPHIGSDFSSKQGSPDTVALYFFGVTTKFMLFPKPTEAKIYSISVKPVVLPMTVIPAEGEGEEDDSTNAFILNYPDVAVALGIQTAAEYYRDTETLQVQELKLRGNPQIRGSRGLLGEMIRDSQKRLDNDNDILSMYPTRDSYISDMMGRNYTRSDWG